MSGNVVTPGLLRILGDMPEHIAVERYDRVWIFPPRIVGEVESGLVVLALRPEGEPDADRREVVTVQYELRLGKGPPLPVREVTGRGWAPCDRMSRMIAGVVRRLGNEEEEPRSGTVAGDLEDWNRFVAQVSEDMVDPANGE